MNYIVLDAAVFNYYRLKKLYLCTEKLLSGLLCIKWQL